MIDEPPWEETKRKLQKYGIFHVRPPLEQARNVPVLGRKRTADELKLKTSPEPSPRSLHKEPAQ